MSSKEKKFTHNLLSWHQNVNERMLPWKGEIDPYKIWLSEVILQQTRAEQGRQYYLHFTGQYPTLCDLANAKDEDVFRLWQGLGYYNRCKNMLATARFICNDLGAAFPNQYDQILSLKGVGAYTAAAISSFAFNLPFAVVDGNVNRVLARYFGLEIAIDSGLGKKKIATLAQELLDIDNPAQYNQAIMDFGATICTPKNALCQECPLEKDCIAWKENLVAILPFKEKKVKVLNRFFNFLVFKYKDSIWIEKRVDKGIWQNLHQFYLIESQASVDYGKIDKEPFFIDHKSKIESIRFDKCYTQRLTHQLIEIKFYLVALNSKKLSISSNGFWIKKEHLNNYAFPKTIVDYINDSIV
jgi:A/G-specific adenine glycosylase